jgi:hypothetical protein
MSESMGGIIPECPGDFVGIRNPVGLGGFPARCRRSSGRIRAHSRMAAFVDDARRAG